MKRFLALLIVALFAAGLSAVSASARPVRSTGPVARAANVKYLEWKTCQNRLHHTGWPGDYEGDNDIHLLGQNLGLYFVQATHAWHPGGRPLLVYITEQYWAPAFKGFITYTMSCKGMYNGSVVSYDRPYPISP